VSNKVITSPLLAYRFGFDADTIWQDPANEDLRKQRLDPRLLRPTDILYIPDQVDKEPVSHALQTGQTNSFVSNPPKSILKSYSRTPSARRSRSP
jgi:hypothetical protein